jgi:hypothetical protein
MAGFGRLACLAAVGLVVAVFPARVRAQTALEAAIKATYLYKFAPFVEWPATTSAAGTSFTICVIGAYPFGALLDQAVSGQAIDGRAVEIRRMDVAVANAPCRIAYLGGSPRQSVSAALAVLIDAPILSVTSGKADGGIIQFTLEGGRVRFRIDDREAARAGLRISSKLLNLAVSVVPRRPPGGRP